MDAVKFIMEQARMCGKPGECEGCKLNESVYCTKLPQEPINKYDAQTTVDIVERWSKEHPRKTRQDGFLAHYPDAQLATGTGNLQICPRHVYRWVEINCNTTTCYNCQKNFWLAEVE